MLCQGVHAEQLPWHDRKGSRDPLIPTRSEYVCSKGEKEMENASFGTSSCHRISGQRPQKTPEPPSKALTIKVMSAGLAACIGVEGTLTLCYGQSQLPLSLQLRLEPGRAEEEANQSSQALPARCCPDFLLRRRKHAKK